MVGWHHQLNGHEFEQAPGAGEDMEAWRAADHGVAKSQTQVSDWTTTMHFSPVCFYNPLHFPSIALITAYI